MISSLDELKSFTLAMAKTLPDTLKDRFMLTSPGCSAEQCKALKESLPGLPQSYLQCIVYINLHRVSIGPFHLWPTGFSGADLAEALLSANFEDHPFQPMLRTYGLYYVASWDVDWIAVAAEESSLGGGVVVKLDGENPESFPQRLACDFSTFLLIVGNLDEIRANNSNLAAFVQVLDAFTKHPEEVSNWLNIAEVVLG
jgi:hypothetical protein